MWVLILNTKIGGTWVHPQPLDQIPFLIQGTCNRSVERCDSAYFYYQAWVPPLNSQVRRSGKRLFLALYKNSSYKFLAYVYNITNKKAFVNCFFYFFCPKCYFLLFHSSNNVFTFSSNVSILLYILANTITNETKATAIGQSCMMSSRFMIICSNPKCLKHII